MLRTGVEARRLRGGRISHSVPEESENAASRESMNDIRVGRVLLENDGCQRGMETKKQATGAFVRQD